MKKRRKRRRNNNPFLFIAVSSLLFTVWGTAQDADSPSSDKMIWADSWLWHDAPEIKIEKWLTDKPEMKDKFILVEFWRTWCGACKRMTPVMNKLHEKYGDDLVVLAITGEPEEAVKSYTGPEKKYFSALDKPKEKKKKNIKEEKKNAPKAADDNKNNADTQTGLPCINKNDPEQGALEAKFGVWGWPHCVLLEPEHRTVIWEGFTGLKGHELTVEKVGKYIEIGKKSRKKKQP